MQLATLSAHYAQRTPVIARPSPIDSLGTWRSYEAGETVYGQEDGGDYWYRLEGGTAPEFAQRSPRRRPIVEFFIPHAFFWLPAGRPYHRAGDFGTSDTT